MQKRNILSIQALLNAYLAGSEKPENIIHQIFERIEEYKSYNVWITVLDKKQVDAQIIAIKNKLSQGIALPLYGIPFAVKDNIDVAGIPTTAGCVEFAYTPENHAPVVQQLIDAGSILIGKTNMDQFATGLVGVRSPYGAVKNAFIPEYISGGSSSGSAVAVALGMAAFSLGTDTAGSGRIPAGFNNLVGLKPTIGAINTDGVVPACKTIDCVSIFSNTIADAHLVFDVAKVPGYNLKAQENKKLKIAIPKATSLFFEETSGYKKLFEKVEERASKEFDIEFLAFDVFSETANLLYNGPWVAERMAATEKFFSEKADKMHPVVRGIIGKAAKYSATDTFKAMYKLEDLKAQAEKIFDNIDFLMVPTAPGIYTINEVEQNPLELNNRLGYYTNYVNLLGLCALAIPAGFTNEGVPFGITLIAKGGKDKELGIWAKQLNTVISKPKTSDKGYIDIAVAGLHKRNQPLVFQLTDLNAHYSCTTSTSAQYKMYLVDPKEKKKPGVVRVENDQIGWPIEVDIWKIPLENLGKFLVQIPHPLGLGKVELIDGTWVQGFICEQYIAAFSEDISHYYRWEDFLATLTSTTETPAS
jgi:allophanate hydrolase